MADAAVGEPADAAEPMPVGGDGAGEGDDASMPPGPRGGTAGQPTTDCSACTAYDAPVRMAEVQPDALAELSGLTASWRNPNVFFAHNDRARAEIYALDGEGALLEQLVLPGAGAVDVEDLGVGPCAAGSCLYLADIGGNLAPRSEYAIFRVQEPLLSELSASPATVSFERLAFVYEDGEHNAEGLLVHPRSGALYVVTKENNGQPSAVYALPDPPSSDQLNTATRVAQLPVPGPMDMAVSAAAAHPCGTGFALRTYNGIYLFSSATTATFAEAFLAQPQALPAPDEMQSEAITFLADGSLVTAGEGSHAPIFRMACSRN